jgi:hypothetical protein
MEHMNADQFIEATHRVMSDQTPLTVNISIMQAWLMVSAVQLAWRHPGLSGAMKRHLREIADQFGDRIVEIHPESRDLLDAGWQPEYDID